MKESHKPFPYFIDLSHPIEDNMPVYPGDDSTRLYQTRFLSRDSHNNHRLEIDMHAGTHIDSPMHLTEYNKYISEAPLETFYGRGCLLDVRNQAVIEMKKDYEETIEEGSIVLLYTGWDAYYGTSRYYDGPVVSEELCRHLTARKIKMLGMDTPSPDSDPFLIHKLLFANGIYIIENLTNLGRLLDATAFEVMAFPLRIKADSSIARVVARVASYKSLSIQSTTY